MKDGKRASPFRYARFDRSAGVRRLRRPPRDSSLNQREWADRMSEPVTYIEIPDWPSLQHYRTRRAAWVKLHVSLLRDDNYLALTAHERAVLHGIWLVYAQTNGCVVGRPSWLSRQLGLRVFRKTLDVLANAGFIEFRVDELSAC